MERTSITGVYKLPNGKFKVVATATCRRTGKLVKKRKTLPLGTTLQEAAQMRTAIQDEIRGEPREEPTRLTFSRYCRLWISQRSTWLKPGTVATYRTVIAHKLLPQLGDLYADEIRRQDLLEWVAWAEAQRKPNGEPFAQDTIRGWLNTLVTICKDLSVDLDVPDPTRRLARPRSSRKKTRTRETLTLPEIGRLMAAMEGSERGRRRIAEVACMAYAGMRSGEVWALHVDDLDGCSAHVHSSVSAGVLTDTTKTGWERHVYLPELVRDAIAAHRRWMLRTQHRGLASGLVFPSDVGTPRTSGSIRKTLAQAALDAGIEQQVTPQVLRRSFNTALVETSVDQLVILSQMGHSNSSMTRHYFDGHIEAKRDALERVFSGGVQ